MSGMEYSDELIIKARQERDRFEEARHSQETVEQEIKQSIYDEVVHVFGIPVQFEDFNIIDGRASIRMPSDFIARSQEEIESVYFLGSKPQYVFSDGFLNFMVALNWTSNAIAEEHIFDFTKFAKNAIERIGPKARILNTEKLQRENGNMSILQFIAQTIDSVNYNVMFFVSLEGRLFIGSINFEQKYAKRLLPLALEMAKSFTINGQREES